MHIESKCPNCKSIGMLLFYEMENVPVNSVLLLSTRKEAIDFPKGDIKLGYCHSCGFIANMVFNPGQVEYSSRYEATQSFSPTFDSYLRKLASQLVEKYDLFTKNIIEIGCGQGEFLSLLCEIGKNSGVGFDPAYNTSRNHGVVQKNITFIKDFFSENYSALKSDFICCRMTLEHIQDTNRFINMIQRSIKESPNAIIFFQVPNVARILQELAFWDIYYEHCSYFSLTSLSHLFRLCGFDILDLETDYDGQYLSITARSTSNLEFLNKQENIPETITNDVIYFKNNYINEIKKWREKINKVKQAGKRTVIWGASSKSVAFLNTLNIRDEIEYLVDINQNKNGTFIAGTGQMIVVPEFLKEYKPEVVIVMNPIYSKEIKQSLNNFGISAKLIVL